MSNVKEIRAKKPHYVDNAAFYDALVEYRKKCVAAKSAYTHVVADWKRDCRPLLKALRSSNKLLYKQFTEDKVLRESEGSWPRDISITYRLPPEPQFQYPRIPEYIGKCIFLIAKGLSSYYKFSGYSYRDEMMADGLEDCILRIQSFDPAKSKNPFAYFTQIAYFAAVRRIKKEKKQKSIKSEMVKNSGIIESLGSNVQGGDDTEYSNQYLSFLLENVDQNTMTEEEKKESLKMKKTTKAHQKRMKDKENAIALNVNGIDGVDTTEIVEEVKEVLDFMMDGDE